MSPGDGKRLRVVRTETDEDVQQLLKASGSDDRSKRLVMLLVSDRGFDSMWSPKKLADMEKAWGMKIVPLYNINLDREAAALTASV